MRTDSAILYQNSSNSVFLIDIPSSITLAQDLQLSSQSFKAAEEEQGASAGRSGARHLVSGSPPQSPYPCLPEPKNEAARIRVMERVSLTERHFHEVQVIPFIRDSLRQIKEGYREYSHDQGSSWCLPRSLMGLIEDPRNVLSKGKTRQDCNASLLSRSGKKRKHEWMANDAIFSLTEDSLSSNLLSSIPPLILSPGINRFENQSEIRNAEVKNPSSSPALIRIRRDAQECSNQQEHFANFTVAPQSGFTLCTLPIQRKTEGILPLAPIPGLTIARKFNFIVLDPPWPNRSARRSAHYATYPPWDMDSLTTTIGSILKTHLYTVSDPPAQFCSLGHRLGECGQQSRQSIAAIWVTNSERSRMAAHDSLHAAGLLVQEEWIWVKTTTVGEPVMPLESLWRKPYEILVIGQKEESPAKLRDESKTRKRLIAAVPDIHSRKPNLKEVIEKVFFSRPVNGDDTCNNGDQNIDLSDRNRDTQRLIDARTEIPCKANRAVIEYTAMEVFARNLTAGWYACGDEALKFNSDEWWSVDE